MITEKAKGFFTARAVPAGGGHVTWTGARQHRSRTPVLRVDGHSTTAARVAFEMRTGRVPTGFVKAECGLVDCVAPEHVEDEPGRLRVRLQARYLAGGAAVPEVCPAGHDQAVRGRLQPNLVPYCAICLVDRHRTGAAA